MTTSVKYRDAESFGATALTTTFLTPGRTYYLFDNQFGAVIGRFTVTKRPHDELFKLADPFETPVMYVLDENGNPERIQLLQHGFEMPLRRLSIMAIGQQAYIRDLLDRQKLRGRRFAVDRSQRDLLP